MEELLILQKTKYKKIIKKTIYRETIKNKDP